MSDLVSRWNRRLCDAAGSYLRVGACVCNCGNVFGSVCAGWHLEVDLRVCREETPECCDLANLCWSELDDIEGHSELLRQADVVLPLGTEKQAQRPFRHARRRRGAKFCKTAGRKDQLSESPCVRARMISTVLAGGRAQVETRRRKKTCIIDAVGQERLCRLHLLSVSPPG